MTQTDRPVKKKRKTSPVTIVVGVVALIALAVFGYYVMQRRAHAKTMNETIIPMMEGAQYKEAVPVIQDFLKSKPPADMEAEAKRYLARCYANFGDDDSLSFADRAKWFRKANDIDPAVLTESQRKEMELGSKIPATTP